MRIQDNNILLVLGASNSPEGLLSPIAISRLDTCFSIYQRSPCPVLLTGGFGPHFNTSDRPHAWYARQYLIGKGVPPHQILDSVNSSNTVEDATLSRPLIQTLQPSHVTIITSEYHLMRAGLIFSDVYQELAPLHFVPAPSYDLQLEELQALMEHEATAVAGLLAHGVRG